MMQLTLVTGNNQKKTISEFKASDFSSLKPSLCTLVIHATLDYLYYSVYFENKCKYLKKLDWHQNYTSILEEEFLKQNAFFAVHVFTHGLESSTIPRSLFSGKKTIPTTHKSIQNAQLEPTNLDSNTKLVLTVSTDITNAVYKVFPEATFHSCIAPLYRSLPTTGIQVGVVNEKEITHVILVKDNQILLSEKYDCPSPTEVLFFTLSALKVNKIEDQALCTFHLGCDAKGGEIYNLFKEYFENIHEFYQNTNSHGFPLNQNDIKDFQIVLNALPCVS